MTTIRPALEDQVDAIRRAVAERSGYATGPDAVRSSGATSALERAQRHAAISAHWGLASSIPVAGPLIVLAQRALRIALRWYVNPIVEQQNAFNDATVAALFELEMENQRLGRRLRELSEPAAKDPTAP